MSSTELIAFANILLDKLDLLAETDPELKFFVNKQRVDLEYIIHPNTPPKVNNMSLTTEQNTKLPLRLTATDLEDTTLSVRLINSPMNGTLTTLDPQGNTIYTPTNGYVGTDVFTYEAVDSRGAVSNTGTVSIDVKAPIVTLDLPPATSTKRVISLAELNAAVMTAAKDTWIVLPDGIYNNLNRLTLKNNNNNRIVIKAENIGKAILAGAPIDLASNDLIFYGFTLQFNAPDDLMFVKSHNVRIARCVFKHPKNGDNQEWLTIKGNNAIIDHNEFANKVNHGTQLLVGSGSSCPKGAKIVYNYFHDRPVLDTPAEAIRIGSSSSAWLEFNAEVAYNRFERIDSEAETCTFKGSKINIHHNTVINCNSSLTSRHGNFKQFNDNIIINSGLRIYGHGHEIKRNQIIEDNHNQLRGHIVIGSADHENDAGAPGVSGPSNAWYGQVRDTVIENNMLIANSVTSNVIFYMGYNSYPYKPIKNTVKNNIISAGKGTLTNGTWVDNTVNGNLLNATLSATYGNMPTTGYTKGDPKLKRNSTGDYVFTTESPIQWTQTVKYLSVNDVGVNAP